MQAPGLPCSSLRRVTRSQRPGHFGPWDLRVSGPKRRKGSRLQGCQAVSDQGMLRMFRTDAHSIAVGVAHDMNYGCCAIGCLRNSPPLHLQAPISITSLRPDTRSIIPSQQSSHDPRDLVDTVASPTHLPTLLHLRHDPIRMSIDVCSSLAMRGRSVSM